MSATLQLLASKKAQLEQELSHLEKQVVFCGRNMIMALLYMAHCQDPTLVSQLYAAI